VVIVLCYHAAKQERGQKMKVIRFEAAETYEPDKNWKRVSLCCEEDISVEHFAKPPGHESPRHSHPSAQVLVVLKGRLAVATEAEGEEVLDEGDAVYIPGNEPHTVGNPLDATCVGIDIFVPGRPFDFWLKRKAEAEAQEGQPGGETNAGGGA
jgi:quercetin dioxygenase-like cupin family protein